MEVDDQMEQWRTEGYQPGLVRNDQGQWTVEFGQDGGLVPEWADWSGGPIWHATKEEAVAAIAMDQQSAGASRRAADRDKT